MTTQQQTLKPTFTVLTLKEGEHGTPPVYGLARIEQTLNADAPGAAATLNAWLSKSNQVAPN